MRTRAIFAALAMLVVPREAAADDDRVKATAAAVVPGVLVHGAGHWVAKRPAAARTLLLAEILGAAAMGAGTATLYFSGASQKLVAPSAALALLGVGLFVGSWLADIEGSATDGEGPGEPRTIVPALEASLGYRFVHDPAFGDRSFLATGFDLRVGRVRLSPEGWFGAGHANERVRLLGAYRIAGALAPGLDGRMSPRRARDGSFVDVELAGVRHAFPPERFTITSVEVGLSGRLDLRRVAPTLRGTFVDGSLGYALSRHAYRVPGSPSEGEEQLLARLAYGLWFGKPSGVWAEVSTFYEHRHDGFAAGMKLPGLFSGVPGSVGARATTWLTPELGGLVEAQFGSAVVFGASLLVRQPVMP